MKFYTFWLSAICIIMFVLQNTIPGFTNSLILNQLSWTQPWRFVTSIFLHESITHILLNLVALLLFGFILEKIVGSKRFLIIFFASGIIANIVAVNFYQSSLGASGAIFGIIGLLTIIRPLMMVWAFSLPLPMFLASIVYIIGNIIQTIVPSDVGTIAHLSGIAVGAVFGFLYRKNFSEKKLNKNKIELPEHYMRSWEDNYIIR